MAEGGGDSTGQTQFPPSELAPEEKSYQGVRYALIYEGESEARMRAGEPLIALVPGVPGSSRDFRHLAPCISAWAPVVRVIMPGFGVLHDVDEAPSAATDRAAYLSMVATAEDWNHYLIVGHSLGGSACVAHAAQESSVAGLCLIASVGVSPHQGLVFGSRSARLWLKLTRIIGLRSLVRSFFAWGLQRGGFRGHPFHLKQLRLILRHIRDLDFQENRHHIDQLSRRDMLPVSLIYAQDDHIVDTVTSQALARELKRVAPHSVIEALETGGHNPQRYRIFEIDRWLRASYSEAQVWISHHPST